jgi:serine-type D-Ala-D-Ala carboxypeptidase/endopeptidase (penicillin-binding protein 4)
VRQESLTSSRSTLYPARLVRDLRFLVASLLVATASLAAAPGSSAVQPLPGPDVPAHVKIASPDPTPSPLSSSGLAAKLEDLIDQAPGASGAWVSDQERSGDQLLFAEDAGKARILASNTKLFTTAAALDRLGPEKRLETRVWKDGPVGPDGTLDGDLYLVGDGDPTFGESEVEALAQDVKDAGIGRVTGKVLVDDTIFDRRRGLGKDPSKPNPYVGPLSGLSYKFGLSGHGFAGKPEIDAGLAFKAELEDRGIGVGGDVDYGKAGAQLQETPPVASVSSEPIAELVEQTNEPSNNFFAEMLLKRLAAGPGAQGTTQAGTREVRAYARSLGTRVRSKDGSGIGRGNRTSPERVGKLLVRMLDEPAGDDFYESLPRAGIEGTVSNRMEGTAAEGRCRAKTGTISGVSALSGYCEIGGEPVAFSILMNGVGNVTAARSIQDRMVTVIARYTR